MREGGGKKRDGKRSGWRDGGREGKREEGSKWRLKGEGGRD